MLLYALCLAQYAVPAMYGMKKLIALYMVIRNNESQPALRDLNFPYIRNATLKPKPSNSPRRRPPLTKN